MPAVPRARLLCALAVLSLLVPVARVHAACPGFGVGGSYAAGGAPQMLASGDFDGDGVADLAVACQTGAPLVILRGVGGGAFAAPVGYTSGSSARALAVSDFNGDGHPDIAECVSNGVTIWLGDGHGAFTGGTLFTAGSSPGGVACGDFDGDGIVDLAVASSNTASVLVLHGRGIGGVGDGTFDAPVTYGVGASPTRIIATDLDGDGILDLAVANNSGASVSVLRGQGAGGRGNGTFTPAATVAATGSPWGVVAVDWNADGVLDLVVSNGAGTVLTLLRGTGACTFAPAGTVTTPTAPRDLVAGDFDGDGIPDLAVACAVGNNVCVLRGTGSGFVPLANFAALSGAAGLVGGDWNGDGIPDLACADAGASAITRFLGSCPAAPTAAVSLLAPLGNETWWPGTAQQVRWTRGAGVLSVDVDLSRDGGATWSPLVHGASGDHADLLATGVPDPHLRARVRDALVPSRASASPTDFTLCGVLGSPIASPAGLVPSCMATGDLDSDGQPDLVAADAAHVVVLRGDGHGRFTLLATLPADSTRQLALADTDGDGIADLVRLSPAGIGVRRGDGSGSFGPESMRALAGATAFVTGDFDGDGTLDVAALAPDGANARLTVWRSTAAGAPWSLTVAGAPGKLASGDFDGDGITDLAAVAGSTVQILQGAGSAARGDGTFTIGASRSLPSVPGDLAVGDFDGNGTPDVLACLPATGDLARLPLAAATSSAGYAAISAPLMSSAGTVAHAPAALDLDGDGVADLVTTLASDGSLAVFRGVAGGFAPASRFAVGSCAGALVVDDFTGDGSPDVVVGTTDGRVLCLPAMCPPQVAATLALSAPADTATACAGFARSISWTRSASVPAVRVELSRDGGHHWTALADGVVGTHYTWIASGPQAASARLRVRDATCGTRFDAGASFAIREPIAAITASAALPGIVAGSCADLEGNGATDAVVTDGTTVQVLSGDGDGSFVEVSRWSEPGVRRVLLRDLDGDGLPELVTLHASELIVRRGLGGGAFQPARAHLIEAGSADVVAGDFNEDGVTDLAIASGGGVNRVSVRLGTGPEADGTPGFSAPTFNALASAPTALASADIDGDGVLDLVVAQTGGLAVLRGGGASGRGNGTFRLVTSRKFGAGDIRALLVADLDGDGRPDLAAADSSAGALLVAAGDGNGGFGAPVTLAMPGAPAGVALADVDHDGVPDLVASLAAGEVALLRGVAGAPLATRFALAGRSATGGGSGTPWIRDTNRDGVADVIVADTSGLLRVLRGGMPAAGAPHLSCAVPAHLTPGAACAIAWAKPAGVALVDVELSRDGGEHWSAVATACDGAGWSWTVTGPYTAMARLRVRDACVATAVDTTVAAFTIDPGVAGVTPGAPAVPVSARLDAPWPNPASGAVTLSFALPSPQRVRVDVCDVSGRRVALLADGAFAAGPHELRWRATNDSGTPLPPGLYFVRARAPGLDAVRRVVLR